MADTGGHRLRIGLLIDSYTIPAWAYTMVQRILDEDYATIDLIIRKDTQERPRGWLTKIVDNRAVLLYVAYRTLENRLFKPCPDAFRSVDASALLCGIPTIEVKPRQTKYSDWIADEDVDAIRQYDLDVLVRLGFRILRGTILEVSRYGIWSYHAGDNTVNRGGPDGVWEILEGHPVTGTILQTLTPDLDNGLVLYRSYSATDPLSINHNRNTYYWKTLAFIPRKLRELYDIGGDRFLRKAQAENSRPPFYSRRLYTFPKNREFAPLILRHLARYIRRRIANVLFVTQWILLFELRDGLSTAFWRFKKILPPRDRFWADPFVVHRDGCYYIFVEEFRYKAARGRIALLIMDSKGKYSGPVTVLERPYHLSYPFVFAWEGDDYMIPESGENRAIDVYKCAEFPLRWEFHATLMADVAAVDATLFQHQGRWWLFANLVEHEGASGWDELFLFSADHPLSTTWHPHPQNPIVSDVRRARPAGRIFTHNGAIYRPSQDSSRGYGYGIRVNEITRLSETEYEEQEVEFIEPKWDSEITGVHTLEHQHRMTMIDARIRRPRYW